MQEGDKKTRRSLTRNRRPFLENAPAQDNAAREGKNRAAIAEYLERFYPNRSRVASPPAERLPTPVDLARLVNEGGLVVPPVTMASSDDALLADNFYANDSLGGQRIAEPGAATSN